MSEFLRGLSGKSSSTDDGKTDDFFQRDSQFVYNMTGAFKFLLCFSLLLAAAQSNVLNANDFQTCMDLCASCDGKASFENGICKCSVREDDTKGMECVKRLKREVEDLSLDATSDDIETGERSARCSLLGNRRRIASGTPLGSTNSACLTSSGDPVTGAINPGNAKPRPAEPEVEKKVDPAIPKSPVVAAPNHACSSPQYQPMVSSSWIPSHDGYAPMIGAPQPYQTGFYPHMLGAIPHMVMAIPNAVMRAASQIPSHHSGMLGASHHSPILASLASGTHGVLQRLDKMVSPYASDNHNNMVGAPQHQISDCQRSSHPTYSASNMVGAPAARVPDSSQINTSMLQQVLAHQNSLLEALSHQLGSLSPQVGAPRMQYAPVTPSHYMLGAPHPMSQYAPQQMGQYVQQPMSHYCPDGSSMVSSPKAAESPEKPAEVSSKEPEKVGAPKDADNKVAAPKDDEDKVAAPKDAEDKSTTEDKVGSAAEKESNKKIEESKKSEDEESQKTKRETRSRSTSRKKRGDVKYAKKRETQSFSY